MGVEGFGHRARHRAQRRVVQHDVDSLTCLFAGIEIPDVGLDKQKLPHAEGLFRESLGVPDGGLCVAPEARAEVVQSGDLLPGGQKRLDEVGADEARRSRNQPAALFRHIDPRQDFRVRSGFCHFDFSPLLSMYFGTTLPMPFMLTLYVNANWH